MSVRRYPAAPDVRAVASVPERFPAATADLLLHATGTVTDPQLHCILHFDGRLDARLLAGAAAALVEAQPSLGCRLVPDPVRPFWERLPEPSRRPRLVVTESVEPERDLERFVVATRDPASGPQAELLLLRVPAGDHARGSTREPAQGSDLLCLKISHLAGDAHSVAGCAYLLASAYRALKVDPGYVPERAHGERGIGPVYKSLSRFELAGLAGATLKAHVRNVAAGRWSFPSRPGPCTSPALLVKHFAGARFQRIERIAKQRGATLNDVMLAGYCRALAALETPGRLKRLRFQTTADLRRYLPPADSLPTAPTANRAGWVYPDFGTAAGANFTDTLDVVQHEMARLKAGCLGLGDWLYYALPLKTLPYAVAGRYIGAVAPLMLRLVLTHPPFTNMGALDPARLDFGGPRVDAAFITVPVLKPPFVYLGLSGFAESLTLTAAFCEPHVPRRAVGRLLDAIDRELP
jgi:NRPS condensation-like uncharacterized protein